MRELLLFTLIAPGVGFLASGQSDLTTKPFHLDKVGYVMLGVASVPAAVEFYHGRLGLAVTMQTDDLAFFNAGSVSIAVSSEAGRKVGDEEVVFTVEHVEGAFDALSRAGITFEHKPHALTESAWAANFRDPDGHLLSVYGPR